MFHQLHKRKSKLRFFNRKNSKTKIRNIEFAALINIRNTNITMDKVMREIIQILKQQQVLNRKSRLIFKTSCKLSQRVLWEGSINGINDGINHIRLQIEYLKENTVLVDQFNYFLFWNQNRSFLNALKNSYRKLEKLGVQILPEEKRLVLKTEICSVQEDLLCRMGPLLNICRIELDFIKTHTPTNLKKVMQNVIEDIPKITLKEKPYAYNSAYIHALEKYKKEFGEKRGFWDALLKTLTIDKGKYPSEFIMLERWIDGKNKKYINSM